MAKIGHSAWSREDLAESYAGRARLFEQMKRFNEAIADWNQVIEFSSDTVRPRFRAARANSRAQAGLLAEAVADVEELIKSPLWASDHWYDFACVYAVASGKIAGKKQEYADRAMELLQKAVKAGYTDAAHLAKDTDLNSLRNRDDFKKLTAELEKKK